MSKQEDHVGALLRSQREAIGNAIVSVGIFRPEEFEWSGKDFLSRGMNGSWTLTHKESEFHFQLTSWKPDINIPAWSLTYSPGPDALFANADHQNFDNVVSELREWLHYLDRELGAKDPWEELSAERGLSAAAAADDPNAAFTEEERQQVFQQLDAIRGYLGENRDLSEAQAAHIEAQFAYLKDATYRCGRKDWFLMAASALAGTAVNAGLTQPQVRDFMRFAAHALASVFQQILAVLPPGTI